MGCFYHSGKYITPSPHSPIQGCLIGWTCCNRKFDFVSNPEAYNYEAKGCHIADKHKEDVHFSEAIERFPFDAEASREGQLRKLLQQECYEKEKQMKKQDFTKLPSKFGEMPPERPGFVIHTVKPGDSLISLSISYRTTTQAIKRANGLFSDMFLSQYLYIPDKI